MNNYLTTDQVATRLKLHQNTVIRYIRDGKLPATKAHWRTHLRMRRLERGGGMGVGRIVYGRVVRRLAAHGPTSDARALRSLAWLVTGMLLEHDVRLERIALAMDGPQTMAARVRRLRRCLDGAVDTCQSSA